MGTRTRPCGKGASLQRLLFVCLFCHFLLGTVSASKSRSKHSPGLLIQAPTVEALEIVVTAEREKERDKAGFDALKQLHKQMDDDQSGSIDRKESLGFLKEDMNIAEADRLRSREKAFHHNNDDSITVDDLWESWFDSEERNWGIEQAVDWLVNAVQLPQYAETFQKNAVDGQTLPTLALQNSTYMTNVLGIKNSVHRQKIQLKALDVVLFGYKDGSSRAKDVVLALLLVGLVTVLIIFKVHKIRSQRELEQLSSKMHELKSLEDNFQGMQEKFEEERKKHQQISDKLAEGGGENQEEVEYLRHQLLEAERRLERTGIGCAPLALQPLLRKTCELEMTYVAHQRMECIKEMRDAMEEVEKLRKKQASLVSSFKLATGSNSGTEDLDQRIHKLKTRMVQITGAMEECQQRWVQIESLCGFPLVGAPPSGRQPPAPFTAAHCFHRLTSTASYQHSHPGSLSLPLQSALAAVPIACGAILHPTGVQSLYIQHPQQHQQPKTSSSVASYPTTMSSSVANGSITSRSETTTPDTPPGGRTPVAKLPVFCIGDQSESMSSTNSTTSSGMRARLKETTGAALENTGRSLSQNSLTTSATSNGSDEKRKRSGIGGLFRKK